MPKKKDAFNEHSKLLIQASTGFSSVCRLCKLRSRPTREWLWTIITVPGHLLEVYCQDCYQILYDKASEHLPGLPPPKRPISVGEARSLGAEHSDTMIELEFSVEIPSYLVKNGMGLRFFWPGDPIDLGLLRQRAKRKREKAKEILP